MYTMELQRIFNECTNCHKEMKAILVNAFDLKAIKEQEQKERLCRKCGKEAKHNDSVLDYELRKAGII